MNKPTPTYAALAAKPISPLMGDYVAWLEAETGYPVDPMSVQLSGVLRGRFQKSAGNQQRIAEATTQREAEAVAKRARAAARAAKPVPAPKKLAAKVPAKKVQPVTRRRPVKSEVSE